MYNNNHSVALQFKNNSRGLTSFENSGEFIAAH